MADPENNDEQQEPKTTWQSSGGCERCDSMDGRLWPEPPGRPHPHCNCTMRRVGQVDGGCDPDTGGIQVQFEGSNHPNSPDDGSDVDLQDEVELIYTYRITCDDGAVYEGEVTVSVTYQDLYDDLEGDIADDRYDEAYDLVEGITDNECRPCPTPHVS